MTSFRAFSWLTWTASLLAVLGYCTAEGRPLLALMTVLASAASALLMRGGMPRSLPRLSINLLVVGATVNVGFQVAMVGAPRVAEMTDFLVYILLIKMFDRGRARDDAQLLGLGIFVMIGAVLESNAFLLGLMLLLYIPLMIVAAMSYQLYAGVRRSAEQRFDVARLAAEGGPGARQAGAPTPEGSMLAVAGAMPLIGTARGARELLMTVVFAVVATAGLSVTGFVLMPRTLNNQVLGSLGEVRVGAETEFRDKIELGQSGSISTSEEPVMDLVLKDEQGNVLAGRSETVYLRGAVLDVYQGRQWLSSVGADPTRQDRGLTILKSPGIGGKVVLGKLDPASPRLVQEISVRYGRENASPLFAMWRPATVSLEDSQVAVSESDLTIHRVRGGGRYAYTVVSIPNYLGGDAPEPQAPLQVAPAVADYARKLAEEVGISPVGGEREPSQTRRLVAHVQNHLRGFTYDLNQVAPQDDEDPIEVFLLRTQRGHCEYFAAAMVSILRTLEVPARIVTGYAAGEYNAISGAYVVRKADAHAWVEARIRPDRWETFDPTPAGSLSAAQRSSRGVLAWIRQAYEALEFRWINNVVAFDPSRRIDLSEAAAQSQQRWRSIGATLSRWSAQLGKLIPGFDASSRGGRMMALALQLGLLAAAGVGLVLAIRSGLERARAAREARRFGPAAGGDDAASREYRRMLLALRRAGLAKPEHTPPLRHARALARGGMGDSRVGELAERLATRFYLARFGGTTPATSGTGDAGLLGELERALNDSAQRARRADR